MPQNVSYIRRHVRRQMLRVWLSSDTSLCEFVDNASEVSRQFQGALCHSLLFFKAGDLPYGINLDTSNKPIQLFFSKIVASDQYIPIYPRTVLTADPLRHACRFHGPRKGGYHGGMRTRRDQREIS